MKLTFHIIILIFLIIIQGCRHGSNTASTTGKNRQFSAPPPDDEYFQEIENEIGLDFVHSIGSSEMTNIVESSCGGAAFLDYDQDGYIDIFVTSGTWIEGFSKGEKPEKSAGNRLYRNIGDGTFEDVTEKSGAGGTCYSMGITVGDYNNDGYPDIYISNYGTNVLLKNNGNGTFTDVTSFAGVGGGRTCSTGAVWLDYDNDGFLDLYVGNYLAFDPAYKYYYSPDGFPGPMAYDSEKDVLYHNQGDGTFRDVTESMGIKDTDGRAMGVGAADYDNDGFMDIYVANDHTLNYLWHNDGGKGFTEKGIMSGTAFGQAGEAAVSMSVDFADYNGDGLLDLFVSDDSYCSLYENLGNGLFSDKGLASGISVSSAQFVGWSSSFFDYDNDGRADIFKTNGALKHLYGQESQVFHNEGGGKFRDNSLELGKYFSRELVGRGTCIGDYDNDGDPDVFVVNLNDHCVFLRNNKGSQNNWLMIRLSGTTSNRDGIGARVKITSGGRTQFIQKISTTGYLSQNDPRLHFGLAKDSVIDRLEIIWPSGKTQTLEKIRANQVLTVIER